MPKPEHVAALAQLVTHALVASPTAPKAAEALYAAVRTHPAVQDAMLAALDAVRDALTSDDPQVVGAMAERVGLHEERATAPVWEQCDRQDCSQWGAGIIVPGDEPPTPHAHGAARWVIKARYVTHWREVPNA